jgi:hypothetical protein
MDTELQLTSVTWPSPMFVSSIAYDLLPPWLLHRRIMLNSGICALCNDPFLPRDQAQVETRKERRRYKQTSKETTSEKATRVPAQSTYYTMQCNACPVPTLKRLCCAVRLGYSSLSFFFFLLSPLSPNHITPCHLSWLHRLLPSPHPAFLAATRQQRRQRRGRP